MKQSDLRVGNWVLYQQTIDDHEPKQMNASDIALFETWKDIYIAIPLTKEWILKFGLKIELLNMDAYDIKLNEFFTLEFQKKDQWNEEDGFHLYVNGTEYDSNVFIKYVHELQNLFFALTGEELTIK